MVGAAALTGNGGASTFAAGLVGMVLGARFENTEEQNAKLGGCAGCGCVPALLACMLVGAIPSTNWDGLGDLFGINGYYDILNFSCTVNSWVALFLAYLVVHLWPTGVNKTLKPRLVILLLLVVGLMLTRFLPGQAASARGYKIPAKIIRIDKLDVRPNVVELRFYYSYYDHGQWHVRRFSPVEAWTSPEAAEKLVKRNPVGSERQLELWVTRDILILDYGY